MDNLASIINFFLVFAFEIMQFATIQTISVLQEPTVMVNTIIANNSFFILYGFLVSCLLFGFWAVSPLGSWVCRILSVVRCDEAEISVLSLIDYYSGQS